MFGIGWMYKKVSNTTSMIVSPSTILLQPHVGGFHASDQEKISISSQHPGQVWPSSGGIAACRLLNSKSLALVRCMRRSVRIVSPSTILLQPHVDGFHSSDQEKILISSQLQDKFGHQVGV